jgi:hypothetical protein
VASLAVLADDDPDWRPTDFHSNLFGCESGIRFPAVKLLDFTAHEAMLEASANPFAQVVLAHLKARKTHDDPANRHAWKVRLVRNLYERGFSARDVRELFRVIDWLMELPPALETVFRGELDRIQEEKRMPYVTSIERLARREGMREGIEALLRVRFGEEGAKLIPEIQEIHEVETLRAVIKALETATSWVQVRRLWSLEWYGYCQGLHESIEAILRLRFGEEGLILMPEIRQIYDEKKLEAILKALETAASPDEVRRLWSRAAST